MLKLELSLDSRLEQVLSYPESRAVLESCIPIMAQTLKYAETTHGFSLRRIVEYARGAITSDQAEALDRGLRALNILVEDSEAGVYTEAYPLTQAAAEVVKEPRHTCIYPGRVWRDTEGKRIQAHGGAVFYEDGVWYWYGENKDRTDGKNPIWTWGIRAYRSTDLYNWEDLGLIIPPNLTNRASGLHPESHADRPHIVRCAETGKYVCWIKQSGSEGVFLILTADAFTGPYRIVRENYRPFGMEVGDYDIAVDEETGKAYLYMDGDHSGVIGMELTEDYTAVRREVSRQYTNLHAPFCREGVTLFTHQGKHYMLTSGMSGYVPNKSDAAVTDDWEKPFVPIGNPHVKDATNASFNSQLSQVFKVPGKDLFISVADRWVPRYPMDARRSDLFERAIASHFDPEHYQVTRPEMAEYLAGNVLEKADTSVSDYVWLPVTIENGMPCIRWYDEWRIEDFNDK